MQSAPAAQWQRMRLGGFTWHVPANPESASLRPYLARPSDLLLPPAQRIKPPSPQSPSEVARVDLSGSGALSIGVKHYRTQKPSDRIKDLFRGPRAWRAARWALVLQQLQLPVIAPLAAGSRWWQPWDSYLITRWTSPTCTFHQFAAAHAHSLERRPPIYEMAAMFARLHDAGISHGDAHLENFLLHLQPAPHLLIVDLDGLRQCSRLSLEQAGQDLQRLLYWTPASPTEQLRFLLKYCRARRQPVDSRKLLAIIQARFQPPEGSPSGSRRKS